MRAKTLARTTPRLLAPLLLVALPLVAACSSTPGLENARRGEFAKLQETLRTKHLKPNQVREIAQAVLSSEIDAAKDREGRPFIRSVRSCKRPLYDALQQRAQIEDGVGAEAALILWEGGKWAGNVSELAVHEDGAWRALSARAVKTERTGNKRRSFFDDPDERVRRAALSAAVEARDPRDREELLEVSRLDPDPMSRSLAYQALGGIGGKKIMGALVDRFRAGNEKIKLAIVDAWSRPGLYGSGGKRQLIRLVSRHNGYVALQAANYLAREEDEALKNQAISRLARFTESGTLGEKRMALRLMPAGHVETTKQLLRSSKSQEDEVAVIAWARLLGNRKVAPQARTALAKMAQSNTSIAYQARSALAATAHESVRPLLIRQAKSPDPISRRVAGYGLLRLGAWADVAPLLGDDSSQVRRALACRVLQTPARPEFVE